MTSRRITGHGLQRGRSVEVSIDGRLVEAFEGESVSAAVMAASELELRRTSAGDPRGYYCGMGACFDCLMVVDGVPNTRTCVTWVRDGMTIERRVGPAGSEDFGAPPPNVR